MMTSCPLPTVPTVVPLASLGLVHTVYRYVFDICISLLDYEYYFIN